MKILLLLLAICAVSLTLSDRVLVENAPQKPSSRPDWKIIQQSEQLKASGNIKLTVALKQRNTEDLERKFWSITNPKSNQFRKYLKFDQVRDLYAPSKSDVSSIISWLEENGVTTYKLHESRDFLTFETDFATAERLLATEFARFQHESGQTFVKAIVPYTVPSSVADKIDFISGTRFPDTKSRLYKKGGNWNKDLHKRMLNRETSPVLDSGNAPSIVYINPLDGIAVTTLLPKCKSGNVYTSNSPTVTALCDSPYLSVISINVNQTGYKNQYFHFVPQELNCKPCNQSSPGHFLTACNQTNYVKGYPANTVYCEVALTELENYVATEFTLTASFSDSSFSDFGFSDLTVYLSQFTTPQLLSQLYNIPQNLQASSLLSNMSVAEFLGQYYSSSDLSRFFQLMGLKNQTSNVEVIGPNDVTQPGGEASLDIQYIMGLAQNIPLTFWSLGQLHDGQEPFLQWITDVLNDVSPPWVHSISYGDDEPSLTTDYMDRVNNEFMKAGVRGLSLLFSSGDNGVFGGGSFTCNEFTPSFPATSPYVTSVGGTLLSTVTSPICEESLYGLPIPCHIVGEVTSSTQTGSRISSGGGFSNVFPQPSYQSNPVSNYVKTTLSNVPSNYYKSTGRAYPDIAMLAHNYLTVIGGSISPVDGTSAAAPVAASVIALLNDYQFSTNQPALGFLNPWLYSISQQNATAFRDVVMGDNSCSEISWICCAYGYPATVGWDASTGLGSLNYGVLVDILKGL